MTETEYLLLPDETGECTNEDSQDRTAEESPFDAHLSEPDEFYISVMDRMEQARAVEPTLRADLNVLLIAARKAARRAGL
jgi:hypothetical protein